MVFKKSEFIAQIDPNKIQTARQKNKNT